MNQHRFTARAAAFGAAVTMMAGGLVASLATTASADGGTFTNVYQCGANEFTVSLTPTAPLPPSLPAGQNVPAGSLKLGITYTVPAEIATALSAFGVTSASMSPKDFALSFGTTTIPLTGTKGGPTAVVAGSALVMSGNATSGSFTPPASAAAVPVRFPTSFNTVIELIGGPLAGSSPETCTIQGAPTTIGTVDIVNQEVGPPPTAPQSVTVKEASPFDGSALKVSWAAPASSGASPVTSYQVILDGNLVSSPVGTSMVLKNPGPGSHTVTVAAVSAAGQGPAATATTTVASISKPREVKAIRGNEGGKLTAGAKWKAPADAGGFAITKYKIAVFNSSGTKLDTEVVKADQLKFLFKLKSGKYFFKVKARNTDRWGPWSKKTDLVQPR